MRWMWFPCDLRSTPKFRRAPRAPGLLPESPPVEAAPGSRRLQCYRCRCLPCLCCRWSGSKLRSSRCRASRGASSPSVAISLRGGPALQTCIATFPPCRDPPRPASSHLPATTLLTHRQDALARRPMPLPGTVRPSRLRCPQLHTAANRHPLPRRSTGGVAHRRTESARGRRQAAGGGKSGAESGCCGRRWGRWGMWMMEMGRRKGSRKGGGWMSFLRLERC